MQIYVAISIIILAAIAIPVVFLARERKHRRPSRIAMFAMSLVVLGVVFGDSRLIGYGFIGAGVLLSTVDIVKKLKNG